MKLVAIAVVVCLFAACESSPRNTSAVERLREADNSFREPFLREKESILAEMIQTASESRANAETLVSLGRASHDEIRRLEAEVLERRIEHDEVVAQLALVLAEKDGTNSATATKRAHLERVLQWLDQLVAIRREIIALVVPRAEAGLVNSNDVLAARLDLHRALLRVQDARMELAALGATTKAR